MTSSLKGADTNHEWMGDDAGELQCSSKSIRNSNMMTCDQSSSNYKTDSGYIAIQYVTKKGQMGKSELTHSFHLCSTIVFTDDEIMEVGVSQSNEIKKSKFKNQKKLDIKNILTDFFLTLLLIFQYLPTHIIHFRSREPIQEILKCRCHQIQHQNQSYKKVSSLKTSKEKSKKFFYIPPYSFFNSTIASTDNKIIKVWVPKSDEIKNSKFKTKK